MDLKILIAAHKKYWMPGDDVYMPLQVGAEGKPKLGYARDNIGVNISTKNPNYCELTGLYWAWKNLEAGYIGLCHYRRYFSHVVHTSDVEKKKQAVLQKNDYVKFLSSYDIIVPKKRNYYIETVRSQYEHAHYKKDLDIVEQIIKDDYPEYEKAFQAVMNRRKLYLYNMFVMKKKDFDRYCTWLFGVLSKAEKEIDTTEYNIYESRVYGFLGERLFNVWLEKEQLKTVEVPVVFLESINWPLKVAKFLKRKFFQGKET